MFVIYKDLRSHLRLYEFLGNYSDISGGLCSSEVALSSETTNGLMFKESPSRHSQLWDAEQRWVAFGKRSSRTAYWSLFQGSRIPSSS